MDERVVSYRMSRLPPNASEFRRHGTLALSLKLRAYHSCDVFTARTESTHPHAFDGSDAP